MLPIVAVVTMETSGGPKNGRRRHRGGSLPLPFILSAVTIVIGAIGIAFEAIGGSTAGRVIISAYALAVAAGYGVRMIREMIHRRFGVDLLAVTAIVATVLVGEYLAAIVVVLMLTGGQALDSAASRRARRELDALLSRAPRVAHRATASGVEDIPAEEAMIGDELLIRPAEIVPVDGTLLVQHAALDESSLTGESMPRSLAPGDVVPSGAINGIAAIRIRATARAADSQYQRIVALVERAAASKAPVVRLADRYAPWFTVFSLALGALAWWVSGQAVRFAEVVVLATPCPLLIAAPVAFLSGMSRAARAGIVVKDSTVLQVLAEARTVVFDKTGTLTRGVPALARIASIAPFTEDQVLAAAASAEQSSSHVLAGAIIAAARDRGLPLRPPSSAVERAANGVEAVVDATRVSVGTAAFVAEHVQWPGRVDLSGGEIAVYVVLDGRPAGVLFLADPVREDAASTVAQLAALGIRDSIMLTGDARETADAIARTVGVARVEAECLPGDKVDAVRRLTARPVLMVGDGVNDAPVLAAADVGVALGAGGATAASEAADAVVLVDDLSRLVSAVTIGRDTVRIAEQSIWLGIIASVGLMVIASFGPIPAIAGAVLQEVVDLATILAALRGRGVLKRSTPRSSPATRSGRPSRRAPRAVRRTR
ncbi:heavy metal translocating P-type ATPase [Curtobacterium ammoniigenes]|uniref:heavy metal translocating P-type ATPase n=1 Tax=Curtobacterium ammoniigenes TaxID=395387 RepID=UPI001FE216FF|nr:heavy metal translocating P-type ATPase [Curtobacterium ammoniigenes]